jgi:hypothetical protein
MPMKEIMKFRRATKPEAYPRRYVEDFAAKYDFIRTSSLTGCSAIGCMLRISGRGKTATGIAPAKNTCEPSDGICNGAVYEFCNWLIL